jgi:fluoroquinolone resistance protein
MQLELRERWKSEEFRGSVQPALDALFELRKYQGPVDLRGLSVGASPKHVLHQVNFVGTEISRVDFSSGSFSMSLSDAVLREVSFAEAEFDGCTFVKTQAVGCSFDGAVMMAYLDDARFEACSFKETRIRSRGRRLILEFGGKRTVFERCVFQGAVFERVLLRAARFRNCVFERCEFTQCDLSGARFEDCTFRGSRISKSTLSGTRFEPAAPVLVECEA